MQVAFYKGRKRLFNRLTSWWLRGAYSHCELLLGTDPLGRTICASSSFMDGGVRVKHMVLDPAHWDVINVEEALTRPATGCRSTTARATTCWAWWASLRACWATTRPGGCAARRLPQCSACPMPGGSIRAACGLR